MKNLVSFAIIIALTAMSMPVSNVCAQGACIAIGKHPSMTFENECDPNPICAEACDECRIIEVTNLCNCCVGSITVSGACTDTCFSSCGEVVKPIRATWSNSNHKCDPGSRTLTPNSTADELCQGDKMAMKVCAPSFPFTIVISWTCNGTPHTQDFTLN